MHGRICALLLVDYVNSDEEDVHALAAAKKHALRSVRQREQCFLARARENAERRAEEGARG